MPYWVEDITKRAMLEEIARAEKPWRERYQEAARVFEKFQGKAPPVISEKNDVFSIAFLVQTWMPLYGAMIFEGSRDACRKFAQKSEEYKVRYEY